jgi:glycine/D-amino acid oxidase-like deaminating enzyme
MIDYLIIGAGLAGIAFAETALKHGKSVRVFDNDFQGSSRIAAGIYNPVILKRFSGLANAQEQLDTLNLFYSNLRAQKGIDSNKPMPILRKFASYEEQNNWFSAADKKELSPFLSTTLITDKFISVTSDFDYGEVRQTGYVDTESLLEKYHTYLHHIHAFSKDTFDYNLMESNNDNVRYKDIEARHIIFAEGFGVCANPFFNYLPLDGTKGEILVIKAPNLHLDVILKAGIFILPLGGQSFKVGATYNWEDKTQGPTPEGKAELLDKIREVIHCEFEIIDHKAGIRPTVKDRKPLIGTHPEHARLHILNGLGTRGVMLGPAMAEKLYDHIEAGTVLEKEISIERFRKLYQAPADRNSQKY